MGSDGGWATKPATGAGKAIRKTVLRVSALNLAAVY
jgi:hypothetical protein